MTLLALLLSLMLERGLTHFLHLRELRWLDGYVDWSGRLIGQRTGHWLKLAAAAFVLLPVVPVALVSEALGSQLLGLPQLAFAVVVLLFSFGPRDLKDEVDDYLAALKCGDEAGASGRVRSMTTRRSSNRTYALAPEDATSEGCLPSSTKPMRVRWAGALASVTDRAVPSA